jgi:hypothetical protein
VSAAVLASLIAAHPANASPVPPWTARATVTYQALQRYLNLGAAGRDLYQENYPKQSGDNPYSYVWALREATTATDSLYGAPGNTPVPAAGDLQRLPAQ